MRKCVTYYHSILFYKQLTSMVSAVGGSLSLYLGISVSMMFEVLEFFADVVFALLFFCAGGGNRVDMNG